MLMRRSGEKFPAEFLVARIQHPTHPGWLANVMDITERKARQRELEMARHLEGLGKLSRQVAHDFNNLLSIVMMNVALARQSAHQSDQLAQLEAITAAAQRGRDIVASLIAMAREHPLEGKLLELSEIIREAEPLYTTVCGASRTISFIHPDSPVWITADRGQLDATLLNLVVNARDATAPNGKIAVRVDTRNVGPGDKLRKPGSYAVIEVSDTGHGMSPEVRQRAFEPFFSTKGAHGAGLGLVTVSGFAHQCGGDVEIESTEGVGTTIRIVLPLASPQVTSTPKPITRNAQQKARILLVDDEPALLQGLAKLLGTAGHDVGTALDGPTALRALAERSFEVLISDIRMPGMSGTELAEQVSAQHPDVAIFLMSGLRPDKVKLRWPFVEKPINIESLLAAIDRHQLHPA